MKINIKNIPFFVYTFVTVIISLLFMIPALFMLSLGKKISSDRYLNRLGELYARNLFFTFGIKVKIIGIENLPKTNNICLVSNHQGTMDIPLIIGYIPKTVGFVAKKELAKIPIMKIWLGAMGCVLIDRTNARSSIKTIQRAINKIQRGHSMVIFPEGTRSRSNKIGKFKPGSFKFAMGANTFLVPLTIDGTYKIMEETGIFTPSNVTLTIHPAIEINKISPAEKKKLHELVENTVRSGLEEPK